MALRQLEAIPRPSQSTFEAALRPMGSRDSTDESGFWSRFEFGVQIRFSPRVRIRIGFDTGGSDSDRFRHLRFGFGSVPALEVRVRIGLTSAGSDSDRRPVRFGFCIRTRGLSLQLARCGRWGCSCAARHAIWGTVVLGGLSSMPQAPQPHLLVLWRGKLAFMVA